MASLDAAGLGAARRQTLLKVLRAALKVADARGYLPRGNIALLSEIPQAAKRRREAPNPERVSRLLATVRDDSRLEAFVLLCLGGGLRRGEVLGLTWGAVDLDSGRLLVQARVNRVRAELGGLIVRSGAKSEAGERATFVAPVMRCVGCAPECVRLGWRVGLSGWARMTQRHQRRTCWSPATGRSGHLRMLKRRSSARASGRVSEMARRSTCSGMTSPVCWLASVFRSCGYGHARPQPRAHDDLLPARCGG